MGVFQDLFGWTDTRTEEQKEKDERLYAKIEEYKAHFGYCFGTEILCMTDEEIIAGIDKCIKYNRKWEGFIVPELDYNDVDI